MFLKEANPDWEYIYWSEKDRLDFIYEYYGWRILKYYLSINPRYGAARADFFRYLCIYQCGGVYLDMKSSCVNPLNSAINENDNFILSQWDSKYDEKYNGWGRGIDINHIPGGEFCQWFIICTHGHPLMKRVIENIIFNIINYDEDIHGVGREATFRITGPYAYTRAISSSFDTFNLKIIDWKHIGLEYTILDKHDDHVGKTRYSNQKSPLIL